MDPLLKTRRKTPRSQRPIVKARKVIEKIKLTLQQKPFQKGITETTEVFVGGSVGHGTAITGHFDLDLVLYSREINHKAAAENGYDDTLKKVKEFLEKNLAPYYTFESTTKVAIKFKYEHPDVGSLEVDLLLSPLFKTKEAFFCGLLDIDDPLKRLMFSVTASKYQTKFIKDKSQRARELIRRAKAWRNVQWKGDKDGRPKSYLISLLVITAYDRAGRQGEKLKFVTNSVNREMVKLVKEVVSDEKLDLTIPGATQPDERYSKLLPPCPRIIDPVNPANNVYLSGISRDPERRNRWAKLAERIHTINLSITAEIMMKRM